MGAMDGPVKKGATYDDLVDLPDHVTGEIIGGDLYASPRPAPRHGVVHLELAAALRSAFGPPGRGPSGWWFLPEPELHLGGDVLVPDLAGWRRERLAGPPPGAFVEVAPDWVCEILSPSTAGRDRVLKLPRYAGHGVGHVWIVDPLARTVEVFRVVSGAVVIAGMFRGSATISAEPFEDVPLDLSTFWLPD